MKKIIVLIVILSAQLVLSQTKITTTKYKHGYNGIDFVVKNNEGTVVVSTYNAKIAIKDEIAEKIYSLYNEKKNSCDKEITLVTKDAVVKGKYKIERKNKLVALNFIYERIEWNSGLVEISE